MRDLCQKIENEQGFLIIMWKMKYPLGRVIKDACAGGKLGRVGLPAMRVVGYSTPRQWAAQLKKYQGGSVYPDPARFYHKCVLEEVTE